ncbi:ankyrin, partial [Ascobolus immersus RN42]
LRVAHDGDINAIDADTGRSPLHSAAWEGNDVLVKALLEQGANPNLKSRNGRTALELVRGKRQTLMRDMLLLRAGRNIDARDEQGRTMLARCAASGNEMAVNRLLDNGANPHIPDFSNKTPLDHAAAAGHSNIIYFLSRKAQNLESVKESLHMATEEVDRKRTHQKLYSSIDELRREGIDIDERDAGGATLLARLASQGNMASVKRMLQRGADCTITNGHGHLPVDLAREAGNTQIVKLLEDHYEEMKRRRK